jgi:hypothetical protein
LGAGSNDCFCAASDFVTLDGGSGFFVLSEKPNPLGCGVVGAAAGFVGGGAFFSFFSSLTLSSSTRRSFDGLKGLSSASTKVETGSATVCALLETVGEPP